MRFRLPRASSRRPLSSSTDALSDSVRIAASGWFSSCTTPADICPSAASLPAWIRSFCNARNSAVRSTTRASRLSWAACKARRETCCWRSARRRCATATISSSSTAQASAALTAAFRAAARAGVSSSSSTMRHRPRFAVRFRGQVVDAVEPHTLGLLVEPLAQLPVQRCQVGIAVGAVLGGFGTQRRRQRRQRTHPPAALRGQDHHVARIEHEHVAGQLGPGALHGVQTHLDGGHAALRSPLLQRVGQVVAGAAGGEADAEEAPAAVRQRVAHIGPEREVGAQRRPGLPGIGGSHGQARTVGHVEVVCAGRRRDATQVAADALAQRRVVGRRQQFEHLRRRLQQRRQVVEAGQFAVQPCSDHIEAFLRVGMQLVECGAQRQRMTQPGRTGGEGQSQAAPTSASACGAGSSLAAHSRPARRARPDRPTVDGDCARR